MCTVGPSTFSFWRKDESSTVSSILTPVVTENFELHRIIFNYYYYIELL